MSIHLEIVVAEHPATGDVSGLRLARHRGINVAMIVNMAIKRGRKRGRRDETGRERTAMVGERLRQSVKTRLTVRRRCRRRGRSVRIWTECDGELLTPGRRLPRLSLTHWPALDLIVG